MTDAGLGQSTCVGIGGDPIIGTTFLDVLQLFAADHETDAIVLIGEIGGAAEETAAAWAAEHLADIPKVAFIAGRTAPEGKRMGHAGAIISGGAGTAASKVEALEAAGFRVAGSPTELPGSPARRRLPGLRSRRDAASRRTLPVRVRPVGDDADPGAAAGDRRRDLVGSQRDRRCAARAGSSSTRSAHTSAGATACRREARTRGRVRSAGRSRPSPSCGRAWETEWPAIERLARRFDDGGPATSSSRAVADLADARPRRRTTARSTASEAAALLTAAGRSPGELDMIDYAEGRRDRRAARADR